MTATNIELTDRAFARMAVRHHLRRLYGEPQLELRPITHHLITKIFDAVDNGTDIEELRIVLSQCIGFVDDALGLIAIEEADAQAIHGEKNA